MRKCSPPMPHLFKWQPWNGRSDPHKLCDCYHYFDTAAAPILKLFCILWAKNRHLWTSSFQTTGPAAMMIATAAAAVTTIKIDLKCLNKRTAIIEDINWEREKDLVSHLILSRSNSYCGITLPDCTVCILIWNLFVLCFVHTDRVYYPSSVKALALCVWMVMGFGDATKETSIQRNNVDTESCKNG